MFKRNTFGVSPTVGVILMVAVTIALVALVTVVVFNIGDTNSSPVRGTVIADINEESRSISIEVLRNENIQDIRVRGAENPSIVSDEGDVGFEEIDIKNGATKVDVLAVVEGKERVIETINLPEGVIEPINLINNPSFESGTDQNASSWDETDTSDSGRSSSFAFDGTHSIAMKDLTGSYGGRLLISDPVSVSSGNKYNFSAYYRLPSSESDFSGTNAADYRYKLELFWLDSTGDKIDELQTTADTSEFDSWNKVSVSGTAPNNVSEAEIRISTKEDNPNNGNIYWDSVSLAQPLK